MANILVKDPDIKISSSMKPYSSQEYFIRGIIILNKPAGPKCRYVVKKVKSTLEVSHAGHAGTLDPKVTGVLPIGLEKATKVLGILTKYPKTYEGEMKLHGKVSLNKLRIASKKFTGKIRQLPPKISAVKRAYRIREIYSFDILSLENQIAFFKVHCEAGTYIRKLCHDLGEYLHVGAHMIKLRRTQSGPFTLKNTTSIETITKEYHLFLHDHKLSHLKKIIKPVEAVAKDLPKVWLDDGAVEKVNLGSPVFAPGILQLTGGIKKGTTVAMISTRNRLIGLGTAKMTSKQMLRTKKGLAVKNDTVLTVQS